MESEVLPTTRKVAVFGTGSIACRHSRVLHRLGFIVDAFTERKDLKGSLDFENNFSQIYSGDWDPGFGEYDFYVIAKITSKHKGIYKRLVGYGVSKKKILCEKPGDEAINIQNTLFNMRHLDIPWKKLGKLEKLVHKANARLWPGKISWDSRYMFRKSMGGGAILTNSHEIDILVQLKHTQEISVKNVSYHKDIDGSLIDSEVELVVDGIPVELSIVEESPVRYWQFENYVIKFYGEIPPLKKKVLVVTADMIEGSYEAMWKDIINNEITRFENMNLTQILYREFI